jgi:hypothetical protein
LHILFLIIGKRKKYSKPIALNHNVFLEAALPNKMG